MSLCFKLHNKKLKLSAIVNTNNNQYFVSIKIADCVIYDLSYWTENEAKTQAKDRFTLLTTALNSVIGN